VQRKILSETTGKVWKIEASIGQSLAAEETILILESMKMEIPVAAPRACNLLELLVSEGDAVREGQAVALVEE
jgi:acetyl-CoA carboxylase biotin carboxyl carrier protein